MENEEVLKQIKQVVEPILQPHGVEMIEVIFHPKGREWRLQIFVDKPEGGITVSECAQLNQRIGDSLDRVDLIGHQYVLEVCSPGLDRGLKTIRDFERVKGRLIRVSAKLAQEAANEFVPLDLVGILLEVNDDCIKVEEEENKKLWEIKRDHIIKAMREIRF
ncbi:MAG: ribosome maturation factor RimP [Candidatus Omnitrophica bacterium]|nr:ribosome maturation factor RimP [Candidatus Omnitrophota bacterium]